MINDNKYTPPLGQLQSHIHNSNIIFFSARRRLNLQECGRQFCWWLKTTNLFLMQKHNRSITIASNNKRQVNLYILINHNYIKTNSAFIFKRLKHNVLLLSHNWYYFTLYVQKYFSNYQKSTELNFFGILVYMGTPYRTRQSFNTSLKLWQSVISCWFWAQSMNCLSSNWHGV